MPGAWRACYPMAYHTAVYYTGWIINMKQFIFFLCALHPDNINNNGDGDDYDNDYDDDDDDDNDDMLIYNTGLHIDMFWHI